MPNYTLTKRQLEVALLASQGLSYAEIGKRLYITPKGVDGHLERIYRLLGINGKKELPSIFIKHKVRVKILVKDLEQA
jgi:DNA-binding CsgD family transcriptional regulator